MTGLVDVFNDSRPVADASEKAPLWTERARLAGDALLDDDVSVQAVWGTDEAPAWSVGESFMLVGDTGVGKSTLLQQVVLGMTGLRHEVLGMPVREVAGRVLYLAMDRPRQIKRSMRRMVTEQDRDRLNQRLILWEGPLPFDLLGDESRALADFVDLLGASALIVDSLKDLAPGLAKDEVGSAVHMAFNEVIARGHEVGVSHHNRKGEKGAGPKTIADVYGSTWLTAGMGSVIAIDGQPGDAMVDLRHLKQPAEPINDGRPLPIVHDHKLGRSQVRSQRKPEELLAAAGSAGMTATDLAEQLYGRAGRNDKARATRRLEKLTSRGLAEVLSKGERGGVGGGAATKWRSTRALTEGDAGAITLPDLSGAILLDGSPHEGNHYPRSHGDHADHGPGDHARGGS